MGNVKRHGGGKYAEIIFRRMIERKISFICFYSSKLYVNQEILDLAENNNIQLFDLEKLSVEDIVNQNGINLIYSALPSSYLKNVECDVVGTIHDLRFLELPYDEIYYKYNGSSIRERLKYFIKSKFRGYAIDKTRASYNQNYFSTKLKVITVSEHSRFEMLSYFSELKGKDIKVFYSPNTSSKKPAQKKDGDKYFLSVSGRVWFKNVLRAIQAFDNLVSSGLIANVKYKITGARESDFKYKIKNPNAFEFLDYVEEDELEELYANAYCFVFPSLSEGFGYPPLEAMRYKVPVISSPVSSMAQILDSGALYFNPFSVEEIMNRMLMILEDSYHHEFSTRGYAQYLKVKERQDNDLDLLIDYITQ